MKHVARGFLCLAILGIIAAIAAPNLLRAKAAANEASAIGSVREVVISQVTYSAMNGSGSYGQLSDLANASLIDSLLGSGTKDDYTFTCSTSGSTFSVNARPLVYGTTGTRSFYSDESGVIRYNTADAPAGSSSLALGQ